MFDDPLSAVDSGVAAHLVQNCFLSLLKLKTRILITHHIHLFEKCKESDISIYLMELGKLQQTSLLHASQAMEQLEDKHDDIEQAVEAQLADSRGDAVFRATKEELGRLSGGKIVEVEKREIGYIKPKVLLNYFRIVGTFVSSLIAISLVLMQFSKNLSDWWTAKWVADIGNSDTSSLDLKILAIIAAANSFFTLFRSFIFAYGGLVAAKRAFRDLLNRVLGASVSFFEANPLGRILNRFSADTYSIDDQFPFMSNIFWAHLCGLVGSVVVILISEWYFVIMIVPLLLSYIQIQKKYRMCSRELKRLDSVTKSPIFSKFSETLDGVNMYTP